jgi:hypothetical protein
VSNYKAPLNDKLDTISKNYIILVLQKIYYSSSPICIFTYEYQLQGFAELEYGMLRYMGSINDSTMIVTTGEFSTDLAYLFNLVMMNNCSIKLVLSIVRKIVLLSLSKHIVCG